MEIIHGRQQMISVAQALRGEGNRTIGFVPTMGALHEGHLSLMRSARLRSDVVVASVFVNPTQFGPKEDFKAYPRDLSRDSEMLASCGVDYVFAPDVEEIYPRGFSTYITVEGLTDRLEGASRPGHFRGVTTVVGILLNIVQPDFAFFGQKDAQQAIVIKHMVRDLAFSTEVVVAPIVREETGLAMSSRNSYLSPDERRAAAVLNRALSQANVSFEAGERNAARLIEIVRTAIAREPLARIDYVSVNNAESLETLEQLNEEPALLSLAAFVGKTRLIDNVVLGKSTRSVGVNA
ncbi:MAG TPA: pantoate--beta-alanine ligase [Pyrinomonadaceae bacterium]|nr:pantoate--beta-alanine ligase [Pyrinomonadaceae bacterium]